MNTIVKSAAVAAALIALSSTAHAQTAPEQKTITVAYTGIVTDDINNTIRIRQPDGSTVPYLGPVPEYPYKKGDTVTLSFSTVVPTAAYYDKYVGQQSADGIYRIALTSPTAGATSPFGVVSNLDVNGPIRTLNTPDGPSVVNGVVIVFDSNTDTYSVDFRPDGTWFSGSWDGPGFLYNANTGEVISTPSTFYCTAITGCSSSSIALGGGFDLIGTANNMTVANAAGIPIWRDDYDGMPSPSGEPKQPIGGFFNFSVAGGWSIPTQTGSSSSTGGVTPVPEPDMLILFGTAAAALVWRRKRAATARA